MQLVALAVALPADCVTAGGQDCNHDEGPGALLGLGSFVLALEIVSLIVAVMAVMAFFLWAREHARRKVDELEAN